MRINPGFYLRWGKRLLDLVLVTLASPVALPVGLIVTLALLPETRAKVLFCQLRSGLYERPFTILKFRTIDPVSGKTGPLGKYLRLSRLDELPQLLLVFKGTISLVGPRPLLPAYTDYYMPEERIRFRVKPGLTGLAQVNGLNSLGWDERLKLDAEYASRISFLLDLQLLAKTIVLLIRGCDSPSESVPLNRDRNPVR